MDEPLSLPNTHTELTPAIRIPEGAVIEIADGFTIDQANTTTHRLWLGSSDPVFSSIVSGGDIWVNDRSRFFGLSGALMAALYSDPTGYTPNTLLIHPGTYAAIRCAADRGAIDRAKRRARMYAQRPRNVRRHAARLAKLAENHPQEYGH